MNTRPKSHSETLPFTNARKAARYSQSAVAGLAGVTYYTVLRFEHGLPMRSKTDALLRRTYAALSQKAAPAPVRNPCDLLNEEWLRRQVDVFLRGNCLGVVERDRRAHFVVSTESVYELGRKLLLAAGRNID